MPVSNGGLSNLEGQGLVNAELIWRKSMVPCAYSDQRANRSAAYDGMWASRRNFDKAFAVARRYHKLPDDLPNKTFETLKKFNLNTFRGENQSIKAEMEKLLASVTEKLCSVK
jgi:hypothetical protein